MKKELKIISLNTWGGRAGEPLLEFFKNNQDIDVFCLQEIIHGGSNDHSEIIENKDEAVIKDYELLVKIQEVLPTHTFYFRPMLKEYMGLSIFCKNNIQVINEEETFVHKFKGYVPEDGIGFCGRNMQCINLKLDNKNISILNFHGLWNGKGKADSSDRIIQSKNIVSFLETQKNDVVLCGDFNLTPDTESIKIIEGTGLRNLIKENNITSTRTSFYTKLEKFADYTFVSPGVQVESFEILPDEVSDHAAMKLIIKV